MKQIYRISSRLGLSLGLICLIAIWANAQPIVKVDFNMSGRSLSEVNQEGYTPWAVSNGGPDTLVVEGVTFIISKGTHGQNLAMSWYKAGVQSPNLARFTNDGLIVKDGDFALGGEIDLRIKGLAAGPHTLLTYHNVVDNMTPETVCPIDIHVDGTRVVDNLIPTIRVMKITDCAVATLPIEARQDQDVVIRFIADTLGTQSIKNLFINGFQLDGVNAENKSRTPVPANLDEHIEPNTGGGYTLSWSPAPSAVSQDVYFGMDSLAVANADHNSPLFKGNQSAANSAYAVDDLYSMNTYYWRVDEVTADQTFKGDIWEFRTRQLAFADAEGYGRFARGGRGGKVVYVTNLNDDGPGSLRAAVTNDIGPRTIVFAVSGLIKLQSRLVLNQPYVTVAGQTAPGKGICIRSAPFGITGNDCIVRFMRVRLGGGTTYDGMGLTGANYSIMDHCSISWTIDEAFSSRGAHNITLQRTLISEALNAAGHQNYPPGTQHGYAATISGDIGSFHHNLLADCYGRNWSLGGGLDGNGMYAGRLDISNNVVYNWGHRTTDGGAMEVNFVNNYYKPGAGTEVFFAFNAQHEAVGTGMQRCYFNGNIMPGYFDETNQAAGRIETGVDVPYETFVPAPFFPSYITLQPAYEAYKNVLSDVGCSVPMLDDHDIRIVKETLAGTYSVVGSVTGEKGFPDNESDAGGFEVYPEITRADNWDSDKDGMPDWWENIKGLNPQSATGDFTESNADDDHDGYTNLENYLHWMAQPHVSSVDGGPVSVDLNALAKGYAQSPEFTVSNPVNGTVQLTDNGVAVFTPATPKTAKFSLAAATPVTGSFTFSVQDAEGSSLTRTVMVASGVDFSLPVRLADFSAHRVNSQQVALKWKTETEINNQSFEIQRSMTGKDDFVKIGKQIVSKAVDGNSAHTLNYELTDQNSFEQATYYRLVQRDINDRLHYSPIKVVAGAGQSEKIRVWPVPSSGRVNIGLEQIASASTIQVYNLLGSCVVEVSAQPHTIKQISLKEKGLYLLRIKNVSNHTLMYEGKVIVR